MWVPTLVRVSIAEMKHHERKASWEDNCLFDLHFPHDLHHRWNSGQELKQGEKNLEAGLKQRLWKGAASWLAPLPWLAFL